jgi:ankyrin repeat protein
MRRTAALFFVLSFAAGASELPPGNQMAVAIERGNLEQVKDLVEKHGLGLTIDYGEGEKVTPIAKACWDGREEIVRYLLEKGADPNGLSGSDKSTPLLEAVKRDRASIVALLIEKGAKVSTKDTREMTPINSAAAAGNIEIVEILVKAKANLESETYGLTPLAFAIAAKKPELVKRLVELGANVNHASKMNGQTALMGAILQGDAEMVRLLLSLKANPNAKMKDGSTPMSMAKNGDLDDIVALLKKAGGK